MLVFSVLCTVNKRYKMYTHHDKAHHGSNAFVWLMILQLLVLLAFNFSYGACWIEYIGGSN